MPGIINGEASLGFTQWTKLIGDNGSQRGNGIVAGSDGSIYIAGNDGGNAFVSKYNSNGNLQWEKDISSLYWNGDIEANAIAIDSNDTVYITGRDKEKVFIRKIYSDGSSGFRVDFETSGGSSFRTYDSGNAISVDSDGSIYVAGLAKGNWEGETNYGHWDAFLLKTDSNGDKLWARNLNFRVLNYKNDEAHAIDIGPDGSVYVVGDTTAGVDWSGTDHDNWNSFLMKFNSDGDEIWEKVIGEGAAEFGRAVLAAQDGSIYIAYTGGSTTYLAKYNSSGVELWKQSYSTTSYELSLTEGSDNSIYIAGSQYSNQPELDGQQPNGNGDAFISKIDPNNGAKEWTKLIGTGASDRSEALATGSDGSIYIAGYTFGDLDGQTNSGNEDAYLMKLKEMN